MVCTFFVRRHEVLRVEVHAGTRAFALVVKDGNGGVQRDEFADAADLRRGVTQVERRLEEERWIRAGMPIVIPDDISR